jgi:riboflavin kinase/FMN adenylyltransferase
MKVFKGTDLGINQEIAATIGFFDGVHLGHRFLIAELNKIAKDRGLSSAIITFERHPRSILRPAEHINLLSTPEEKLEQLASTGVENCIIMDFTPELSRLSAKEFISSILREKLNVRTLIIGYDHRFGHDRTDGFEQYVEYGNACGMEIIEAEAFDGGKANISSSEVRRTLSKGDVEETAKLLSSPYSITGRIVSGYKVGRELGFPTANIEVKNPYKMLPAIGVYAVWVYLKGERHKGMLYIGNRPTLDNGKEVTIEVNILDFNDDIYNNEITVAFISYVRGDSKFNSLDELKQQLAKDRETVAGLLK